METVLKNIHSILSEYDMFEIPIFQRPYIWEEKQIDDLLEPIFNMLQSQDKIKKRFLGTIVLKKNQYDRSTVVIDGQQRLTTISLLLKVLQDKLDKLSQNSTEFKDLAEELQQENYLYKKESGQLKVKLAPLKFQKHYWDILITKGIDSLEECRYTENYTIMDNILSDSLDFLEETNLADIRRFLDLIKNNLTIITILLDENENEFEIFETLNSLGQPLNTRDLIKNTLLEHESPNHLPLYENKWRPTFEENETTTKFWESKGPKIRSSEEHQDFFFDTYLQIQLDEMIPENVKAQKVYHKYVEYLKKENDKEKELDHIQKYATTYRNIFDENYAGKAQFPQEVVQLLSLVKRLERHIYYPFIVYFLTNCKNDGKKLAKVLSSYIISRILAEKGTVNDQGMNKTMHNLLGKLKKGGMEEVLRHLGRNHSYNKDASPVDKFPTFPLIKKGIETKSITEKIAKSILIFLEESLAKQKGETTGINTVNTQIELEHIIPKKYEQNWKIEGKKEETIKKEIKKLGNLTLVTGKMNKAIQNSSFNMKKKEYSKSQLILNQELSHNYSDFTYDSIKKRAGDLAELFHSVLADPDDLV